MKTISITLDAAMQYWSANKSLRERATATRPTKCGVIGLIASASGYAYDDDISALAACRFAVSEIRPGVIERDYKTVGTQLIPALPGDLIAGAKLVKNDTKSGEYWISGAPRKNVDHTKIVRGSANVPDSAEAPPKIIIEEYLADAAFTVALEGQDSTIDSIYHALQSPARALYLGKRAYSPSAPFVDEDSVSNQSLENVISTWSGDVWCEIKDNQPRSYLVQDQPLKYGVNQKRGMRREIFIPQETDDFFDF